MHRLPLGRVIALAGFFLTPALSFAATDTTIAGAIVERCYPVLSTASEIELSQLEEKMHSELRTESTATAAVGESAEAEVAITQSRLAQLYAGLGETVALAVAETALGAPGTSASAATKEIANGVAAGPAKQIATSENELQQAKVRLAESELRRLRLAAVANGVQRCIDDQRVRIQTQASATPGTTAPGTAAVPSPAPEPVPTPDVAPEPAPEAASEPEPAPAPSPEIAEAPAEDPVPPPEIPAPNAIALDPNNWEGALSGWYDGKCKAVGTPTHSFRHSFRFEVAYGGAIEGWFSWTRIDDGVGGAMAGSMDDKGDIVMSSDWKGQMVFKGQAAVATNGPVEAAGTFVWERPYETCTGHWTAS